MTTEEMIQLIIAVTSQGGYVLVTPDRQVLYGDVDHVRLAMQEFLILEHLPMEGTQQ